MASREQWVTAGGSRWHFSRMCAQASARSFAYPRSESYDPSFYVPCKLCVPRDQAALQDSGGGE